MPIFEYTGTDRSGNAVKATLEADTSRNARLKAKKSGVVLLSLVEKDVVKKRASGFSLSGRSVDLQVLALTTRQFASLIRANIPLVEALTALIDQTEDLHLKGVLADVRQAVNQGSSLKSSLAAHPKVFPPIFINMVESGEASGTLPLVLLRLSEFMEAQVRLRAKVLSAMTYPILMIAIGGMVVLILFTFVIPKVAGIFQSINKKLPWYTELIMNVSFFVKDYWWLLAIIMVGTFFTFRRYIATTTGKAWWDSFLLRLPVFGPVVRMIAMSRFASTMATLMNGGVPILSAMNIVKAVVNSVPIAEAITKAQANITEGQSVAEPLRRSGEFPNLLLHMIQIGERTGELPQMLELVSKNYEEQVNNRVDRMTTLLQPLMLVVMGVLVGIIVMAIFVPLLELQQIR